MTDFDQPLSSRGAKFLPGTTLAELFPGNTGRLHFVRIMLRLMHPGLHEWPWDEPLSMELLSKIQVAIAQDERE